MGVSLRAGPLLGSLGYYEGLRDLTERLRAKTSSVSDPILAGRSIESEAGGKYPPFSNNIADIGPLASPGAAPDR